MYWYYLKHEYYGAVWPHNILFIIVYLLQRFDTPLNIYSVVIGWSRWWHEVTTARHIGAAASQFPLLMFTLVLMQVRTQVRLIPPRGFNEQVRLLPPRGFTS